LTSREHWQWFGFGFSPAGADEDVDDGVDDDVDDEVDL
jgi:hypothetical protein